VPQKARVLLDWRASPLSARQLTYDDVPPPHVKERRHGLQSPRHGDRQPPDRVQGRLAHKGGKLEQVAPTPQPKGDEARQRVEHRGQGALQHDDQKLQGEPQGALGSVAGREGRAAALGERFCCRRHCC
jgi:hypothetical protein